MRALAVLLLLLHGSFAAGAAQNPVTLRSSLLEQLRTTHAQQDWFVPLKPALEGVTPAQATWKPQGGDHSIGQLANHLLFWNSRRLARFTHPPDATYGGDNDETFNAFDAARWDETQQQLDRVLSDLEKLVSEADARTLESWAPTLGRIATHNPYHGGQILSLRKMQGAWDPAKGVK